MNKNKHSNKLRKMSNANVVLNMKIEHIEQINQPALYEQSFDSNVEKDLNESILKLSMTIHEDYPELSKYIEEMKETIPNSNNPEITSSSLKRYYNSLKALLDNYIVEQAVKKEL
jgi:nitrate/nitrite-specific signal transduction histidine kinase